MSGLPLAVAGAATDADVAARARIEFLAGEIARHDELYFRKAQPEITDAEYDALKRELVALRREQGLDNGVLSGVGDDRVDGFVKRRHLAPMLSLEKVYSEAELTHWHRGIAERIPGMSTKLVLEPKFDGVAISATYESGRLVRVVTRGNGEEGDDVTENALRFCRVPTTLDASRAPVPARVEVRGEAYISLPELERINGVRRERGEPEFASPRNLAAGTLKSLGEGAVESRALSVVFFGHGAIEGLADSPASHRELIERFRAWGLPTAQLWREADTLESAIASIREWERARLGWSYPIDGVVLKLDAFDVRRALGESREAPKWAVAYKFTASRKTTRLRAITLQVGRTGVLTPVAELEPVEIAGAIVARASLHNAGEIARRDIRVGDFVEVERAGEVIPRIVRVDLSRRSPEAEPFQFPENCPVCGETVEHRPGEVARRCPNPACPEQLKRRLRHFVSASALGVRGLGPATIDALVESGKVRGLADLYRLSPSDLVEVTRLGPESARSLVDAIESSRRSERWRVVNGLGLPGVGEALSKGFAEQFRSVRELVSASEEELANVPGIGTAAAVEIAGYLRRPAVERELAALAGIFDVER